MRKRIKYLWESAVDLLLPRTCPVCRQSLDTDERYLCRRCLASLPRTHFEDIPFNPFEQAMMAGPRIERAVSYFYYDRGGAYASILHDIKYRGMPALGRWMAARAATDMAPGGCFDGIEAIVPVPMHRHKEIDRGYNQSRVIAEGLADVLRCDVVDALVATRGHATQTRKSVQERLDNMRDLFALDTARSPLVAGRHVLLVDDVVTTGATLLACARVLSTVPGVTISAFTLASARLQS